MKIGILGTAYHAKDTIEKTLSPWLNAKFNQYGNNEFIISIASVPFKEYQDIPGFEEDHDTYRMLETLIMYEEINYLTTTPLYMTEAETRTAALGPLMIDKCDLIWLVDFQDEYYTKPVIEKALSFIDLNRHSSWFSFNLRNYVFDDKHYLEDLFMPPRIFKTKTNGYTLDKFYFDNDITYKSDIDDKEVSYKSLPSINFPNSIYVKHLTWLNNENSKRKIEYQSKHFSHGAGCSYRWNDEKKCVEFNIEYFNKTGQTMPIVLEE